MEVVLGRVVYITGLLVVQLQRVSTKEGGRILRSHKIEVLEVNGISFPGILTQDYTSLIFR